MNEITQQEVTSAIDNFLSTQLAKKLEPELKKLEKADTEEKQRAIKETIDQLQTKFSKEIWLEDASTRMAKQLTFGTHISKGVHPDAKGDNVNFLSEQKLPAGVIGSQLVENPELDANGNAAALPLAAFYNIEIGHSKLRHLIQQEHTAIKGAFSHNPSTSIERAEIFKASLDNIIDEPTTHERNKQLLWPIDTTSKNNNYRCLIPLYPSSLTHSLFHKINNARYSEENKEARDNRHKKTVDHQPYVSIQDLTATILGGANSQNVSLLTGKQKGRNYLLASLPPKFTQTKQFSITKKQSSFFGNQLRYHCFFGFKELFSAVDKPKNTVSERDQRKEAISMILAQVVSLASTIQQSYAPGWSRDYMLDIQQKYWLDPQRAFLEDEEKFAQEKTESDWLDQIQNQFSLWLNAELRKQYPKQAIDFDDTEFKEWRREIESVIKASQRAQEGVFA